MTYQINTNLPKTVYTINSTSDTLLTTGYNYNNIVWNSVADGTTKPSLDVKGDANFQGDVKIQGKSIVDSLERIEERLAILRPNEELEEKWDKLRGLRQAYMELEAEIKEKELIWATLKK